MEKKTLKLTAVAAGAVVLAGAAFAAPSFASAKHSSFKAASSSSSTTGTPSTPPTFGGKDDSDHERGPHGNPFGGHFNGVEATLAATITGVASTVTDPEVAEHSAQFIAYDFTGTAPTTKPTTGGHPVRFEVTTLANGTATGTLGLLAPKTAGTYTVAVYNSKTSTTPVIVTIVVDSAGKATATASGALTATYDATLKAPAFGGPAGGRGHGDHETNG
jgi:hypothetical protein